MNTYRLLPRARRAFTLIELMLVLALVAVILTLAAPPMLNFIAFQRLKSVNAQTGADFQYARSEAVSRNEFVGITTDADSTGKVTCYTIFASSVDPRIIPSTGTCNCRLGAGAACSGWREVRTVQMPPNSGLSYEIHPRQITWMNFDPVTGGVQTDPADTHAVYGESFCLGVRREGGGRMRAGVNLVGRLEICSPDGSVNGAPVCPQQNFTRTAEVRGCITESF